MNSNMTHLPLLKIIREAAARATIQAMIEVDPSASSGIGTFREKNVIDADIFLAELDRAIEAERPKCTCNSPDFVSRHGHLSNCPEAEPNVCPTDGSCEACQ